MWSALKKSSLTLPCRLLESESVTDNLTYIFINSDNTYHSLKCLITLGGSNGATTFISQMVSWSLNTKTKRLKKVNCDFHTLDAYTYALFRTVSTSKKTDIIQRYYRNQCLTQISIFLPHLDPCKTFFICQDMAYWHINEAVWNMGWMQHENSYRFCSRIASINGMCML